MQWLITKKPLDKSKWNPEVKLIKKKKKRKRKKRRAKRKQRINSKPKYCDVNNYIKC